MDGSDPGDLFERAAEIVNDALDLPIQEQTGYVRDRCEGDRLLLETALRFLDNARGPFLRDPVYRRGAIRTGDVLGLRFHVLEKLGEGGMGTVFRARDELLKDVVALKTIRAVVNEPSLQERFRAEIRLARSIAHPNVCPIFDLFTFPDESGGVISFFTMKYLEGQTLADRIAAGPLPIDEVVDIAAGIASGLDAAHVAGVIHRDLKPRNVILARTAGGSMPVIMDFGLAKAVKNSMAGEITEKTQILGSPQYMAPEQFLGENVGPAADIYALALLVFEMTTGKRPYPEENVLSSAVRRTTKPPPSIRTVNEAIPKSWDDALGRALAPDPKDRHVSAGQLVRELRASPPRVHFPFSKRVARRTALGVGISAVAVSCFVEIRRLLVRQRYANEPPKLMIADFSHEPSEKAGTMARALVLLLKTQIEQSAHIELVSTERVSRLAARMQAASGQAPDLANETVAREIALRAGAPWVLFGNVSRLANEFTLHTELDLLASDPGGVRQRWTNNYDFGDADIDAASSVAQRVAHTVREQLGESQADWQVRSQTPDELTTSNWGALRLYVQATALTQQADRPKAIDLLRQAISLDNGFAAAYGRLADYLTAAGYLDDGLTNHAIAADLVRTRNLTDRESLRIRGMFAQDTGQYKMAADTYHQWRQLYSADSLPCFYESMASRRLGQTTYSDALLQQAIQRDPENYAYAIEKAARRLRSGDLDGAEKQCRAASRLEVSGWTDRMLSAIAFGRGDGKQLWAALERMESYPGHRVAALQMKGCFRAEQKRWGDAEQLLAQAVAEVERSTDAAEDLAQGRLMLAELHLLQGRTRDVREDCRLMLSTMGGKVVRMRVGGLLARSGYVSEARACLVACPDWPVYRHWRTRLSAELALAEGNFGEADRLAASTPESLVDDVWPESSFRAFGRSGDASRQASLIQEFTRSPGIYWLCCIYSGPGSLRAAIESCEAANGVCRSLGRMFS